MPLHLLDTPYQPHPGLPEHLARWQLPPGWQWGVESLMGEFRHYQEVIDGLGRSLSLVTAPEPSHKEWLFEEARALAQRGHPAVPTTYHYWASFEDTPRGPGYLRRWIAGETLEARLRRVGQEQLLYVLQAVRSAGSALVYLHDTGVAHGGVSAYNMWVTPTGRLFLLGWQWALPRELIPAGVSPDMRFMPVPPEWSDGAWRPTPESDQWQLAATCFQLLTGEHPPVDDPPPLRLLRPEVPHSVSAAIEQALAANPEWRFPSVAALLRALDRGVASRTMVGVEDETALQAPFASDEARLRWATGDDYEVLSALGTGTFGSVWRVRDLTLEREVALKMLHPRYSLDASAITRFRREARLAASLAHPAIIPIYDWDSRGDVQWYTMELAEGGSVKDLVERSGPRTLDEIAVQVALVLDALVAAHGSGIIHRDLKPENILIDRHRRWRVTDFGIANVTGEDAATTTGTPAFAAPEQLLGEAQGPAVDCFAAAAIVAFVLSGVPPFGDVDPRVVLARELSGEVDLAPFPPPIARWLERGLAADPEVRFSDAAEMLTAWRAAVDEALGAEHRVPWWRRWFGEGGATRSGSDALRSPA